MLLCDADTQNAADKRKAILENHKTKDDFMLEAYEDNLALNVKVKTIPIYTYIFPDDFGSGNLENILLETAQVAYPELLSLAKEYIEQFNISEATRRLSKYEIL